MQIVLEGPDNAGKSTLAAHLVDMLGLPIQHSGGPSKFPGEVNTRTFEFNQRRMTQIFDRHPAVSQNIYVAALMNDGELVTQDNVDEFYARKPLIIYCRNINGTDGHELSEHSSAEYFSAVEKAMPRLKQLYDEWALERATIVYRIGDDMDRIVSFVQARLERARLAKPTFDPLGDITEFHYRFKQEYSSLPRVLPQGLFDFRAKFLKEELQEWLDAHDDARAAIRSRDEADLVNYLETQLDSLVDLAYVLFGTVHLQGFGSIFSEAWRRVHAANMRKVLAMEAGVDATDSGRDRRFDVIKPKGWEPPKHTDLVENHGNRADLRQGFLQEHTATGK